MKKTFRVFRQFKIVSTSWLDFFSPEKFEETQRFGVVLEQRFWSENKLRLFSCRTTGKCFGSNAGTWKDSHKGTWVWQCQDLPSFYCTISAEVHNLKVYMHQNIFKLDSSGHLTPRDLPIASYSYIDTNLLLNKFHLLQNPKLQTQGRFGPSIFGASLSPHGDLSRCQAGFCVQNQRRQKRVHAISGGGVTKDDSHHPQFRLLDWQKVLVLWCLVDGGGFFPPSKILREMWVLEWCHCYLERFNLHMPWFSRGGRRKMIQFDVRWRDLQGWPATTRSCWSWRLPAGRKYGIIPALPKKSKKRVYFEQCHSKHTPSWIENDGRRSYDCMNFV